MNDFIKGVVFAVGIAGIYKLGVCIGRKTTTKIEIEMDSEFKEILERLEKKLNKKGS